MKAAIVSPTEFLSLIQPFSDYHLVLTHKVIYDSRYCNFYAQRSKAGDYLLLDNSAIEKKGRSVPLRDVVLAAVLTHPQVVFLPDYLFDRYRTLHEVESALRSPQLRFLRRVLPDVKLAAVPQGLNDTEWLECFEALNDNRDIDVLGIPKVTGKIFGSRLHALELIHPDKPCHLLGCWWESPLSDLSKEAQFSFVVGVDTPKPVRLAVQGKTLSQWNDLEHDRGFLDRRGMKVDVELLRRNCEEFVRLCGKTD